MAEDSVVIKGNQNGITIVLNANLNFELAKQSIYEKLQSRRNFFSGGTANIDVQAGF